MKPKLSIGILVESGATPLRTVLHSILKQIEVPIQIVIFDCLRTSEVRHAIYDARKEYEFPRHVSLKIPSSQDRVKLALKEMRSEYVWLLSDGDMLMPGCLVDVLQVLKEHPDLTGMSVGAQGFDSRMKRKVNLHYPVRVKKSTLFDDACQCYRKLNGWFCILSNHIFHREKMLEAMEKENAGTLAAHCYPITKMLKSNPRWYFFSKKCIGRRVQDSGQGDFRRFVNDMSSFVRLRKLFNMQLQIKESELANDLNLRFFKMKLKGLSSQAIKTIFRITFTHYRNCPAFWLRFLPLYLAPRWGLYLFERFMRLFNWQIG